ncbi:uncharacterized protein [Gossypium hirsutum]|uniref:Uncharacterized protein n=1 Tax=Gossypium hirsutum TaxID=3635 RepID=A0ABM2YRC6_GOSHI|nr:uncharacterized protein LOC121205066 [Gossypium hirsutum]
MNQWYHETIQGRSQAQQPPPPPTVPPITTPVAPPLIDESSKRTPIEKLRKFGAEEFRGRSDDDPVKAEYWLKSLERVFKQMMCSPEDYLRCAVLLLKEEAYNWWETIEAVVPADKLTWEFFQNEFKKKYAQDVVPTEEEMCIRFEEGLNDEIRMMIGGIEIREFVVLSDQAQKMEEVYNKKMQRERRGKEKGKRSGQSSAAGTVHSGTRDIGARSETRVPARTYAIRAREEASAPDVIAEFDVILGIDWLIEHNAIVNCREKLIDLKCQTGEIVSAEFGDKKNDVRIISAFTARKLIRKDNEAFLAYILDTRGSELKIEQLSVVNEFTDVFPKELPGLPPDCEVEFTIDSESFDQLKKMLTEAPVLTQPESGKANVVADALSRKSSLFALRAMNAHFALNEEGAVLVELKAKPMFLQQIQKL